MLTKPLGSFTFSAAKNDDGSIDASVLQYNIYGKQGDASVTFAPEDLKFAVAAVADQAQYTVNLGDIPGLLGANGENYAFAVAAQDHAGNVADFSNVQSFPLDEKAPNAISDFTYVPPSA